MINYLLGKLDNLSTKNIYYGSCSNLDELDLSNCNLIRITCISYPPEENPSGTPISMTVNNYCNIIISRNEWELNTNKTYRLIDEIDYPNYIHFGIKNNKLKITGYDHYNISLWKIIVEKIL